MNARSLSWEGLTGGLLIHSWEIFPSQMPCFNGYTQDEEADT